jgi:hypothetical protein
LLSIPLLWALILHPSKNRERDDALAFGGRRFTIKTNNQTIVGDSNGRDDGEDTQQGGACGDGVISLFGVANQTTEKLQNKIQHDLIWLSFDILHTTTNQKHAGAMEKGWEKTRNWAVMLGECDSIILG